MLFTDTSPEVEAFLIERLRHTSGRRKWQMLGQLNHAVHDLALGGLRQRHPQATEAELRRRLADMLLGAELATTVYGPLEPGEL